MPQFTIVIETRRAHGEAFENALAAWANCDGVFVKIERARGAQQSRAGYARGYIERIEERESARRREWDAIFCGAQTEKKRVRGVCFIRNMARKCFAVLRQKNATETQLTSAMHSITEALCNEDHHAIARILGCCKRIKKNATPILCARCAPARIPRVSGSEGLRGAGAP